MGTINKTFWKELKKLGVLPDNKLLLALSGGLDSVVLFHLLKEARMSFSVAHVNYGLRGEDSDQDEAFCIDLCKKNGITCHVYDAKAEMASRASGASIQERAREIRYAFFMKLLDKESFDYILTAHHAHDSVETFFVNLMRGAGSQGLGGIRKKNGNIIRPLLSFQKKELEAYALQNQLQWREDVSNAKNDYLRNRIRHYVIPSLEKADGDAIVRIRQNMRHLADESALMDYFMEQYFPESLAETEKKNILSFPESLRALVIFKRYRPLGIHFSQAEDMAQALSGIPGKRFILPSHQLLVDRDLIYAEEIQSVDDLPVILHDESGSLPGYCVSVISRGDWTISKSTHEAYLDLDKLRFPLTWRKITQGDAMVPLGMKGRKKISDILIDTKISRFEKAQRHVLCSGDEIVWLEGFRINDSSKITDSTSRILCIIPEKL